MNFLNSVLSGFSDNEKKVVLLILKKSLETDFTFSDEKIVNFESSNYTIDDKKYDEPTNLTEDLISIILTYITYFKININKEITFHNKIYLSIESNINYKTFDDVICIKNTAIIEDYDTYKEVKLDSTKPSTSTSTTSSTSSTASTLTNSVKKNVTMDTILSILTALN
jgi:hypothetical protein